MLTSHLYPASAIHARPCIAYTSCVLGKLHDLSSYIAGPHTKFVSHIYPASSDRKCEGRLQPLGAALCKEADVSRADYRASEAGDTYPLRKLHL